MRCHSVGFGTKTECGQQRNRVRSRSHDAVIRVYDSAGNVIERTSKLAIFASRERKPSKHDEHAKIIALVDKTADELSQGHHPPGQSGHSGR